MKERKPDGMCLFPEKFGGLPSHSICDWHIDCEGCQYYQERDSEKRAKKQFQTNPNLTNQLRNNIRDINRISQILGDLKKIWELTPDIRLGQLLLNAVGHDEKTLFYIEDQDLIDKMFHEIYSNLMKELKDGEKR